MQHLSWHADSQLILDDISFTIKKGSFTGILGPNGAGKSSLLRCLYRYVKPDSGLVEFNQKDIWQKYDAYQYAQDIAVVLQETPTHFNLTVHDVVALGLLPHKGLFTREQASDRLKIDRAIKQVGLVDKNLQNFEHLSGGEKQRVAIARAIVNQPDIIIADEPTGNLDPIATYEVVQILKKINDLGTTVIMTTHNKGVIDELERRVVTMDDGRIVRDDSSGKYVL